MVTEYSLSLCWLWCLLEVTVLCWCKQYFLLYFQYLHIVAIYTTTSCQTMAIHSNGNHSRLHEGLFCSMRGMHAKLISPVIQLFIVQGKNKKGLSICLKTGCAGQGSLKIGGKNTNSPLNPAPFLVFPAAGMCCCSHVPFTGRLRRSGIGCSIVWHWNRVGF